MYKTYSRMDMQKAIFIKVAEIREMRYANYRTYDLFEDIIKYITPHSVQSVSDYIRKQPNYIKKELKELNDITIKCNDIHRELDPLYLLVNNYNINKKIRMSIKNDIKNLTSQKQLYINQIKSKELFLESLDRKLDHNRIFNIVHFQGIDCSTIARGTEKYNMNNIINIKGYPFASKDDFNNILDEVIAKHYQYPKILSELDELMNMVKLYNENVKTGIYDFETYTELENKKDNKDVKKNDNESSNTDGATKKATKLISKLFS